MTTFEPWVRAFTARTRGSSRLETGASAVEYGLLIAGIAGLIVAAVFVFGGGVTELFGGTCSTLVENASTGTCD